MIKISTLYPGKYVIYKNGDKCELGRVTSIADAYHVFVCYHEGETSALTPKENLFAIDNDYLIEKTAIHGGKVELFGREVL